MNRKERRALERRVKHIQHTKPWELQAMIRDVYSRDLAESRLNNEILAPGDKVMFDLVKMAKDPEWDKFKPEYKEFVLSHANEVFTLRKEARQDGAFGLVSFIEDENEPKFMHYLGHLKKVKSANGNNTGGDAIAAE